VPRGPKGHKRPADVVGNAVVALMDTDRLSTGSGRVKSQT